MLSARLIFARPRERKPAPPASCGPATAHLSLRRARDAPRGRSPQRHAGLL